MALTARGRRFAIPIALAAGLALAACGEDAPNENPFTSEGFANAVDAVEEDAGDDAELVQVQIKEGRALFKMREDGSTSVLVFPGDVFEPIGPEAVGEEPEGEEFPLSEVDPDAIDRILEGVGEESEVEGIEVPVMTLKRSPDADLGWVIDARGGGRRLVFEAEADGSGVALREP